MAIKLGVVMDPIANINFKKDSTLAMLLEASRRGWELYYMEQGDLFLQNAAIAANMQRLEVADNPERWFELSTELTQGLATLDVVLMRKDPPVDMHYIYTTFLLDLAERDGALVINRPRAVRDANEKLSAVWFPQCSPPTLVTSSKPRIRAFLEKHGEIVLKPLDAMGGTSVFKLTEGDPNTNVAIETLTLNGSKLTMAQRYVPEISAGDKRILLIDGEPVPYGLARIPASGEFRGNLAAGGKGVGVPLTDRDRWICAQVGPTLRDMGLLFVGLDVIGDYLTEINVTSPTCIRELDSIYGLNIAATVVDSIQSKLPDGKRP